MTGVFHARNDSAAALNLGDLVYQTHDDRVLGYATEIHRQPDRVDVVLNMGCSGVPLSLEATCTNCGKSLPKHVVKCKNCGNRE